MEPVHIDVVFEPLMPHEDNSRRQPFSREDYKIAWAESFDDIARELIDLSVSLLRLLPDPSLSPNERLERLARVVPTSRMVTAHRRNARAKLEELRRRLAELVPNPELTSQQRLAWLINRLDELVPGDGRAIKKLEQLGDFRSTDIGVSPWNWQ